MDKRHLLPTKEKKSRKLKLGFAFQLFGWYFFIGIIGKNKDPEEGINAQDIE